MTNKIFKSMLKVAMVVLLVCLIISSCFFYDYYSREQSKQLKNELRIMVFQVEKHGEEYLSDYVSTLFRITLISPDGKVLFDNIADVAEMENHISREEVTEALKTGSGSSVRYSTTLTVKSLYEAVLLSNGNVLRISSKQYTIGVLIMGMMPAIIAMIIMTALFSLLLSSKMAKGITKPLNSIDLDSPEEVDVYEELAPMISKIKKQHKHISKQMDELKRKSSEFEQIIAYMNEGLILLDKGGNVMSMNPAAKHLYEIYNLHVVGRSFFGIDKTPEMKEALHSALNGKNCELYREIKGSEYRFDISGIESDDTIMGAVILCFDVTQKALAEKSRREFTANVSHELKTPLQSVIGSAELLENGLVKQEDIPKFVGNIKNEAVRLVSLINDIIRLSQLDENSEQDFEDVDLYEVASEVTDLLKQNCEQNRIKLSLQGYSCIVKGVRGFIYEIIYNLCDNAIRYNVPNGSVQVNVYSERGHAILQVKDTGIGIASDQQNRVFERFYRVDKSHSKETGGTGLGLSIVKHAAMIMNASVKLESAPNMGTCITITF